MPTPAQKITLGEMGHFLPLVAIFFANAIFRVVDRTVDDLILHRGIGKEAPFHSKFVMAASNIKIL